MTGEYWHFTSQSKRRLFGDVFGRENLKAARTFGLLVSPTCMGWAREIRLIRSTTMIPLTS
jgi:hypothetical protein